MLLGKYRNILVFRVCCSKAEYRHTTQMVADFYGVDERTVKRYLENYSDELKHNGYVLSKGKHLKDFKLQFGHVVNVTSKTSRATA